MGVTAKGIPRGCQGLFTPVSLGYPLSVFNKNSTLKFELRETGDWDIFLGPPERAKAETGGADQCVLKRMECQGFARVNQVTSASLRYPLSVFNKNSTLERFCKSLIFLCSTC